MMTPDELPADMEAVVEADILYAGKGPLAVTRTTTLRALLKAYQEQRRALERLAAVEAFDHPQAIDSMLAQELWARIDYARAALNQKGDER
jgi:hypothetical protein